jgi:YidC/Oxa1 family membrane protein insertase
VLTFLHIPSPLGFSIILLTAAIRLALYPLMATQLRSSKKMQEIAPHLSKLKEQYKGNAQRIQAETMLLYKKYGINPAAGCLPAIIQLPIIWGLYAVLQEVVKQNTLSSINKLVYLDSLKLHAVWDTHFFGIPLGQNPGQLLSSIGFLILLVPIITGLSQFVQSKMMFAPAQKATPSKKEPSSPSDFATTFQSQSMILFPIMIGFFSFRFPIGLSLYWITFTIFGIIQQYKMQGWGGMAPLLAKAKPGVETPELPAKRTTKKKK